MNRKRLPTVGEATKTIARGLLSTSLFSRLIFDNRDEGSPSHRVAPCDFALVFRQAQQFYATIPRHLRVFRHFTSNMEDSRMKKRFVAFGRKASILSLLVGVSITLASCDGSKQKKGTTSTAIKTGECVDWFGERKRRDR